MAVTKEQKKKLIEEFAWKGNSGAPEAQIAILTAEIKNLQEHLETHKKDNHSRRWIILMVAKRRKLLNYLKRKNPEKHAEILKKLGIRK